MKVYLKTIPAWLISAVLLSVVAQCSEEELTPRATAAEAPAAPALDAGSVTITGLFTRYEDVADCTTCTYVVPADATLIDGKELSLSPGDVICLDKALSYGDVEFVNLAGTDKQPITIGAARFN